MNIQNINLNQKHFDEAVSVIKAQEKELSKLGDTILVLEDETEVLVIIRKPLILCQYLQSLL